MAYSCKNFFNWTLMNSNNSEVTPPQQTVDTTYPTNLDGIVRNVTTCNQLQLTLDAAQPGDTVSLSPSLACIGNFTLENKSNPNNKWIVIRSASTEFDASGMLRAGNRVNGENSLHTQEMPKLYTNNNSPVLEIEEGADYYRIVGIEIGTDPNCSSGCSDVTGGLVVLTESTNQVHHITIDRCYIHGRLTSSSPNIKRAISLQGNNLAVIDSHISKIIARPGTFQNQAIGIWSGSGPIKIENNYLEALAQNILIGGATPAGGETIKDIVIRRNYFHKSDALYLEFGCNTDFTSCPGFPPTNGIEIKRGIRVQITENFFDQTLAGVFIKVTADNGCINCIAEHINVENNKFKNVRHAFNAIASEGSSGGPNGTAQNPNHITVKNNLSYFTDTSGNTVKGYTGTYGISGRNDIPDFKIIHNTYESDHAFWGTYIPSNLFNFEMRDNIFERRYYGLGGYEGTPQLNMTLFPYTFRKNVLVNNSQGTDQEFPDSAFTKGYPCTSIDSFCTEIGTYISSGWDSAGTDGDTVGFQIGSLASRRAAGNYRLSSSSSYHNAGTDGTDIGVNQNVLDLATYGSVTGIWQSAYPGPNASTVPGIIEAENFDNGGPGAAYTDNFGTTGSSSYRSNPVEAVDIRSDSKASNGYEIFEAAAGEWYEYTINVPTAGKYDLSVRYANEFSGGKIRIEIDGVDVTGQMTVGYTGGWTVFRRVTKKNVALSAGTHTLRLIMDANSTGGCNCVVADIDSILFTPTPFDFDGDGLSDISVFRSSNNTWYLQQSTGGFSSITPPNPPFSTSGDTLVPGDFDGDGKTDIAHWNSGTWNILKSSNSTTQTISFGSSGDIPNPADYDGDGKADAAVFRPSTGVWYILNSSDSSVTITSFGTTGDKPVAADYDGDGKADIAIYRPNGISGAEWWLNRSSAGVVTYTFGINTDKAVQGDYTGDGKADVAVWRPSNGNWYILRSEDSSFYSFPFGVSTDIPTPGDYDGDGFADAAVFRPSNITWYLQQSTSGFTAVTFGLSTDTPIPSVYVR